MGLLLTIAKMYYIGIYRIRSRFTKRKFYYNCNIRGKVYMQEFGKTEYIYSIEKPDPTASVRI